ncbi:MAG: ribonuclease III domain-containing protein [Cyanobacteria bacterium J06635_10]
MKPEDISYVEQCLGYTFKNKALLIRALTRKAFAQEQSQRGQNCEDQEVYRILGDAVLKVILVEMLIEKGYDSRESITNKKSDLEKRDNLGKMFQEIGIAPFIRFGIGEEKQGISKQSSVLGETFEALVAAVHVDTRSYETTKGLFINLFNKAALGHSKKKASSQDSQLDEISKMWMLFNVCETCVHPDVCGTMRMCYLDVSGD